LVNSILVFLSEGMAYRRDDTLQARERADLLAATGPERLSGALTGPDAVERVATMSPDWARPRLTASSDTSATRPTRGLVPPTARAPEP
jgi:hypothetical protein